MKLLKLTAVIGILTLALGAPWAQGYYMEVTGSRGSTDTSQLVSTGAFGAEKGFQISWHITEATPGGRSIMNILSQGWMRGPWVKP